MSHEDVRESSPGRRIVRAKVLGRESSKEKCQEVRIAAVNRDTLLGRHGIPSRTTYPEGNDYLSTESPQSGLPSFLSPRFLLLTLPPHQESSQLGSSCQLTTPSNFNKNRIANAVRKAISTFIHNSEAIANVPL